MLTLTKRNLVRIAILILDKAYFKTRIIIQNKDNNYIKINMSILQEGIILNVYAPKNSKSKYVRKKADKTAKRKKKRQIHYYTWKLQHSFSN